MAKTNTGFKTHKILYEHHGENSDTAKTAVAVYKKGMERGGKPVDLDEMKTCCLYWGDDRLVSVKRYDIHTVTLPAWLRPEVWLRNQIELKWLWAIFPMDIPERWTWALTAQSTEMKMLCAALLNTKEFRSDFRQAMRDQLVTWLDTHPDKRQYPTPFSRRQADCLETPGLRRKAKQLGESLYRSNRYTPIIPGTSKAG
jgi:hypothetical protein